MAQVPSHVDTSAALGSAPLAQVAVYPLGAYWAMISRTQGRWIARIALGRRPDPNPAQTPHLHVSHSAAQVGTVAPGPVVAVPVAKSGALDRQEARQVPRPGAHGLTVSGNDEASGHRAWMVTKVSPSLTIVNCRRLADEIGTDAGYHAGWEPTA